MRHLQAGQVERPTEPLGLTHAQHRQVQSILEYNGGACVAMVGKNCVAIARCASLRRLNGHTTMCHRLDMEQGRWEPSAAGSMDLGTR